MKDRHMIELWDDLAMRVDENTSRVCRGCTETCHPDGDEP